MDEKRELSDNELENVNGGNFGPIKIMHDYKCNKCQETWRGIMLRKCKKCKSIDNVVEIS